MSIAKIAEEMKRNGEDIISLGIGDTHFSPPKIIQQALIRALNAGKTHYTEAQGVLPLREAIAGYYQNTYSPAEIFVSAGLKEALYVLLLSMDVQRVCILEPAWLGYEATCVLAGKEYVSISYYNTNWLEQLAGTAFDALILCSPNNPDGKIFDSKTIHFIKSVAEKKNAWVIIDEIYKVYDYRNTENSVMNIFWKMDKAIIGNGFSKSHAMTGLRIGYLLAKDEDLIKRMVVIQQNLSTCPNSLSQFAGVHFIEAMEEVMAYKTYYEKNRSLVCEIIPSLAPFMPDGGFYYFIDVHSLGWKGDGISFCNEMLVSEKIALVPGNAYGTGFENFVRLSFSIDRTQLEKALLKLKKYLK